MNYLLKIRLSHFNDAQVIRYDGLDGKTEEGIFIPFRKNRIRKTKRAIIMNFFVRETKNNLYGESHIVFPYWGKGDELHKFRTRFGNAPIIGTLKPFFKVTNFWGRSPKDYVKID